MGKTRSGMLFLVALAVAAVPAAAAPNAADARRATLSEAYGRLPLAFEANQGQADPRVRFLARGRGYSLFLTSTEAVLSLKPAPAAAGARVRMAVLGANSAAKVTGMAKLPGKSHYIVGSDPAAWRTDIPSYGAVRYEAVYPGVDLVFHGSKQGQLEYDFVVAPGADPGRIRLGFEGAKALTLDGEGNLVLRTGGGDVIERAPVAYQDIRGSRHPVDVRYERRGRHAFGFRVAAYDRRLPLVIDPVLVYSTYLGGVGGTTRGWAVAVDGAGNAYVTGGTTAANFPGFAGLQPSLAGSSDAFVTKFSPSGALVYSTFLGGASNEAGAGIAVDSSGSAYLAGLTGSNDFPTVNPLQPAHAALDDVFVAKLSPSGASLVYSTYLGSSGVDRASGIAVDGSGSAYVTGSTFVGNFPTVNAVQPSRPGNGDGFVAKLSPAGNSLVYSTYLGGNSLDEPHGIAVDGAGSAYVTGMTFSLNFPTANALQGSKPGPTSAQQVFLTKLAPAGDVLAYSTYVGGTTCNGSGNGVAVDGAGSAYVTGQTCSTDFPVIGAIQGSNAGGVDAFIFKLSPAGNALVYSTYLGGTGGDLGSGIALDGAGDIYLTGRTVSIDFPLVRAVQSMNAGRGDVFASRLSSAGDALAYSTYIGGSDEEVNPVGNNIAVDAAGNAYVVGYTYSSDFRTVNALQAARNGPGEDAFVFKLAPDPPPAADPVANAGPDETTEEGALVTLDGSASGDPNGDALSYHWEQIAGPAVTLSDPTAAQPVFVAPSVPVGGATLSFRLVVDDGVHTSPPDTVDVTVTNVNQAPVADAGPGQTVQEGRPVTLDAGASFDPDGDALTYAWTQASGPAVALSDPAAAAPTFTAPPVGGGGETLMFDVTVSDGAAESTDAVQVLVVNVNQVPVAVAGADQTVDEATAVALSAAASSDPDGDALTYAWTQLSGPPVTPSDATSVTPAFTAPAVGLGGETLVFQLVVSDGAASSVPDEVTVTVRDTNQPPSCELARAGLPVLWPPNHRLLRVGIVGLADPDDEGVAITVTAVTQDEPVDGRGDGDTSPDAVLQGANALVRAERSGHGNGRVYHLSFTATDAGGASCTGTVTVCVPHDRGCGQHHDHRADCVDEGPLYDSLVP